MTRSPVRSHPRFVAIAAALVLALAACGDDDGAEVRDLGDETSGSGSGTAGGSPGSATGIVTEGLDETTDNALVAAAVEGYADYVDEQISEMIAATTVLTDAVRAGDLEAARAAYAPSRVPWERIEPIAALIEEIDGAVDARVDDFAGTDDPAFTGWHRLEHILFELGTTDGAAELADRLDADLQTLDEQMDTLELPPAAVAIGAAELVEEVSAGKITGEEDRYSKTDLWDFEANLVGAQRIVELLTPALTEADPELLAGIEAAFDELFITLEPLRDGEGWVLYCLPDDQFPSERCTGPTVDAATVDLLKAQLGGLSENISLVAGALGLQ